MPTKVALADGTKYTWLPMLSNVLTDADSELLHTAALQVRCAHEADFSRCITQ